MSYELIFESENETLSISTFSYLKIATEKIIDELKIDRHLMISTLVVDEKKIQEINKEFRGIDATTDVISFAYLDDKSEIISETGPIDLGEIIICYEVACRQSEEFNHSLLREITFLYIHGLLHLLTFDHTEEDCAIIMYELQNKILNSIEFMEE